MGFECTAACFGGDCDASEAISNALTLDTRNASKSSYFGNSLVLAREVSQAYRVGLSSSLDILCAKIQSPKSSLGTIKCSDLRILDISKMSVLSDAGFLG